MSINHNTEQILTQHNPLFYLDGCVVMPSQAAHECVRLGFSSQDKKLFLETMPGVINTDVNHLNLKWKPMFLFEIERERESSWGKLNSGKVMYTLKLESKKHQTSSIVDW